MDDSDHRCHSGEYCVALTPDGAALTTRMDTLCHGCITRLQEQYDELRVIRKVLEMFKGGLWGQSGEAKVSSSSEPSPPLNVHALDVINEVEEVLEDVGSLPVADLVRHENGVSRSLRIGKVWCQSDGIIGISRVWSRRFANCPECEQRTLGCYAGSESIECASCNIRLTRDEYSVLCLQSLK
ncbi:hypothetical protein SEA_KASHFLOW_130 [Mycobacterium phage KashFlow]|nr:hypothetical protein SEA_KASHFLOW_130 [Mycobacterium phage KashFlow]